MPTLGLTPPLRRTRAVLVAGYAGVVALGLLSERQPRVFWTMLLPLLPVGIVLIGFHTWRNVCPLAFFGDLSRRLKRSRQRRVPAWLERGFFPVTFAILLLMLVLRLVATNGDRFWLTGLLLVLALAAAATNAVFTGKTWCNFVCPVGFVERIYTEPRPLRAGATSQCLPCTACKRHCPDIDQENAYWKDVTSGGRRLATYAFPGLVLGFYTYYWLRHGDWEAYFDGRWTLRPVDAALVTGPGFFFAPRIPAVVAATLTLLAFSLASYLLFRLLEVGLRGLGRGEERSRHLGLALAAFSAFNLFYLFAGAPSLRHLPGGVRLVAFAAPLVSTLFLVRRWQRTPEHFLAERGAARLLRSWPFDEPPPKSASGVYGWIQASRVAREKTVGAYETAVRDMVAEGLVRRRDLRLLDGLRRQLCISQREHEQLLARLSEEERQLFVEDGGVEKQVQLEGYQVALAEALQRNANEEEIDELRASFGVGPVGHQAVLARIRGQSGELFSRARRQLERAKRLQGELAILGATEPTPARIFLCFQLGHARDERLSRVVELLEIAGDGPVIRSLRPRLFAPNAEQRKPALQVLALACPGAEDMVRELAPLLAERSFPAPAGGPQAEVQALARLLEEQSPYLRAAAVWAASTLRDESLEAALARARADEHPLVRETAERFAVASGHDSASPTGLATIETLYFLHVAPFFAELDPEDLHELAQFAIEQTVEPPAALCEAGDTGSDALFVLVSGRAVVTRPGDGAVERSIATLGPGDLVGELSVLDGSPRSATVRPQGGPLRVLRIPGPSLRSALLHRPQVAQSLLGLLAGRLRRTVQARPQW
jgi:CRP-like cAMP-binding protein